MGIKRVSGGYKEGVWKMAKMAKSLWARNLCLHKMCWTQNIWVHLEFKENLELQCSHAQPNLFYKLFFEHKAFLYNFVVVIFLWSKLGFLKKNNSNIFKQFCLLFWKTIEMNMKYKVGATLCLSVSDLGKSTECSVDRSIRRGNKGEAWQPSFNKLFKLKEIIIYLLSPLVCQIFLGSMLLQYYGFMHYFCLCVCQKKI